MALGLKNGPAGEIGKFLVANHQIDAVLSATAGSVAMGHLVGLSKSGAMKVTVPGAAAPFRDVPHGEIIAVSDAGDRVTVKWWNVARFCRIPMKDASNSNSGAIGSAIYFSLAKNQGYTVSATDFNVGACTIAGNSAYAGTGYSIVAVRG